MNLSSNQQEFLDLVLAGHNLFLTGRAGTGDINTIFDDFLEGNSLTKLAKKYGTTRNTIALRLKENGIVVPNIQNRPKFNYMVFDSIDTEEKAYRLGFIFADGYISSPDKSGKKRYAFEVSLALKDYTHLLKLESFLGHESSIVKRDHFRCRLSVSNRHFWETLNSYGCTPAKSLTLKFPDERIFKDKLLIKHFIRGYIDGDGTLFSGKPGPIMSILGTFNFLMGIQRNLPLKKQNKIHLHNKSSTKTYSLSFGHNSAVDLTRYLYKDTNLFLDRKLSKYFAIQKQKGKNTGTIMLPWLFSEPRPMYRLF